ncbi:sensor histidine kinase [Leucobacter sp. M11]|uniref:sensor histidine kinase n=1 Tax=Leucobacter sp. M11 TaxID=2993565 RepID=UPI002D7FFA6F|nr:HAMP domain-containing sensor histidine kinase [Leucobacter sp. M11]MEB4613709.1 HAMP domain-containing sensor histidine kinase [Leucobacter sp. M11]
MISQVESTLYLSSDSALTQVSNSLEQTGELPTLDDFSIVIPPDGFFLVLNGRDPRLSAFFTRDFDYRTLSMAEIREIRAQPFAIKDTLSMGLSAAGHFLVTADVVEGAEGAEYTVITGVGLNETNAVITTYVIWMSVAGLALAAVTAALGYRLVSRELTPLEHVAHIAQQVTATPLSTGEVSPQGRVPRDPRLRGSEADRVAKALNLLLEHVESSLNARHRAEESMRRFIAEASHELRNPLASILGYADFYAQPGADAEEMGIALGRVRAEARRMSTLVNDLLLLARLDADPQLNVNRIDLSQVVLETVSDTRFVFPEHSWQISVPDGAVIIDGDEDAIRQMLLNLVANAGYHTPPGTRVLVSIQQTEQQTELAVTDDGPGIPASALPRLFDRFTQAGESATRTSTVGLGLAIVKALASASGFEVGVDSNADGSRFTVTIPRRPPVEGRRESAVV